VAALTTATLAVAGAAAPGAAWAAAPAPADTTFLRGAHQSNLAEIAAGRDAQANATTDCVRQVGAVLVRDHRKLDRQAAPVVRRLNVELPTAPAPAQRQALAAVRAKAGSSAYDAAWLAAQEKGHRQTLALIDKELSAGSDASVKALARAARPVVQMHLEMVEGGTCHAGHGASAVGAGTGGQAAAAEQRRELGGAGLLGAGALLLAGGTAILFRRRGSAQPR
jgi:putative membrane protein